MIKKYKALFVSEDCHTKVKQIAALEKISITFLVESLLNKKINETNKNKRN